MGRLVSPIQRFIWGPSGRTSQVWQKAVCSPRLACNRLRQAEGGFEWRRVQLLLCRPSVMTWARNNGHCGARKATHLAAAAAAAAA